MIEIEQFTALVKAADDGSTWSQAYPYTCSTKQYPKK